MKIRYSLSIIACIAFFAHCSPKVQKEISDSTTPVKQDSYVVNRTAEELENGKMYMTQGCQRCHVLFDPKDFTVKEWEPILKAMLPKAKMGPDETALIKDYIIANAKDYKK